MSLTVRSLPDLGGVEASTWDALDHGPSPFLEHGFLRALELTGSTGGQSGWIPQYLIAEQDGRLVGAVPAFIKLHSYGEYIFDFMWARAAMRAGLRYFPKLVIAAPVTPATGRRILLAPGCDRALVARALVAAVRELADAAGCSSIHWLFTTEDEHALLGELGFAPRASFQYHWHNRGYRSFDDFLAALASRKRKQLRKERQRCRAHIDGVDFVPGDALEPDDLDAIDRYYRRTVYRHGGDDYLQPGFFHKLRELAPHRMQLARVRQRGETIAGAIFLETDQALYGRYWGCDRDVDMLHFETAYYAGIDRCIARGIPRFEAGAQGEHKLLRGFEPTRTYSSHWIRDPDLDRAIRGFLREEAREVAARMQQLAAYLPYRRDGAPG